MNGSDQHPITFLRTSWKFAAISQWMHLFHAAIGLEKFDTEKLENELSGFGTDQDYIIDLNKRLLKAINAFRSIKDDTWESLVRKEFNKRVPDEPNPFGQEPPPRLENGEAEIKESPIKMENGEIQDGDNKTESGEPASEPTPEAIHWNDLTLDQKVHVMHSLCEWTLVDANRFKELNKQQNEEEQITWRVDPVGFDAKGNTYWLFDDNRLYQQAAESTKPAKKAPAKTKKRKRGYERRSSRRQLVIDNSDSSLSEEDDYEQTDGDEEKDASWQTVCVTLHEWETFPQRFKGSKNPDEKYFYKVLEQDLLPPILDELKKIEKEKIMQEALIHRKRSSRLVGKELQEEAERKRQQEEEAKREEERKATREAALKARQDESRQERLRTREERASDREERLARREQQVLEKKLYAERKAEERRKRKEAKEKGLLKPGSDTEEEAQSEENWTFDCVCGAHGENYDDGREMVICDECHVWQHTDCVKQEAKAAGKPIKDWETYICTRCQQKNKRKKDEDGEVDVMAVSDEDTKAALKPSNNAVELKVTKLHVKPPAAPATNAAGSDKPKKPRKPRKPSAAKLAKEAAAAGAAVNVASPSGPTMASWGPQQSVVPQSLPPYSSVQMQAPRPLAYASPLPALSRTLPPPPSTSMPSSASRPPAPPMMSSSFGPPPRPPVSQAYPLQHQSYSSQSPQAPPRDQQQQYSPMPASNGVASMRPSPPPANSYRPLSQSTLPVPMSSIPAYQQYPSPSALPSFTYNTVPRPMHQSSGPLQQSSAPLQQYSRPSSNFMQAQRPMYNNATAPGQGQLPPYQMYSQPVHTSSPSQNAHSFAPTTSYPPSAHPTYASPSNSNPAQAQAGQTLSLPLPPNQNSSPNPNPNSNHGHAKKSSMDLKFMME